MHTKIKVIGAGFGRTGTMSVKHALEMLDLGPCYHMIELTNEPERLKYWEVAANGKKPDWNTLLNGYSSIMDFPGCLYYQELMAAYPEAKVILTVRDAEDWYKSARATIFKSYPDRKQLITIVKRYFSSKRIRQLMRLGWLIQKIIYKQTFGYQMFNKEEAIRRYEAHNQKVIETVPADKLLVYNVQEGWTPLCNFIGKEIPNVPFPKTNKPDHFHNMKNVALSGQVSEEMKKG
jgi:hypothetical protein